MIDADNAVGRLRRLAERLSPHKDAQVTAVLGKALDANPNAVEFHLRMALLIETVEQAAAQIVDLREDPNGGAYAAAVALIGKTLDDVDMRENWVKYQDAFNLRTVTLLESCERAVAHRLVAKPPAKEALDGVLKDVRDAKDTLTEADLDADARRLLLEMLRDVERALLAYEISGLAGLRRAVERTIGAVVLHQTTFDEKVRASEAAKKAFGALAKTITLVRNVEFIRQLSERVGGVFHFIP